MAQPSNSGAMAYMPNLRSIRSYLFRIPLCTRGFLLVMVAFFFVGLGWPGLQQWGALIPKEINLQTLYRLNTYPLIHIGPIHLLLNLLSIAPLLERFEAENGTLVTFILFSGPFSTVPGLAYVLVEYGVFRSNTAVSGASIWVFLLLSSEAIKLWRQNPNLSLGPYQIPTWSTPLIGILFITFLIPRASLLGHLAGAGIGYLWGLGYIKFLAPPEKALRWIEGKLNLLGRLPHYVSVDQKTYGRYGVLDSREREEREDGVRLGP